MHTGSPSSQSPLSGARPPHAALYDDLGLHHGASLATPVHDAIEQNDLVHALPRVLQCTIRDAHSGFILLLVLAIFPRDALMHLEGFAHGLFLMVVIPRIPRTEKGLRAKPQLLPIISGGFLPTTDINGLQLVHFLLQRNASWEGPATELGYELGRPRD